MAKTGYRFNPETLSYDRIHVSVKKKLWSLVVKFFSSLSLALVIFLIVSAIEQRIGAYGRGVEKSGNPG